MGFLMLGLQFALPMSIKEIQKIFERSLLSLVSAGIKRLDAGVDRQTASAVKRLLKSIGKKAKTKAPQPSINSYGINHYPFRR